MGPRSFDRGNGKTMLFHNGTASLQWGRDHSIAETDGVQIPAFDLVELQWGRDHSIAETKPLHSPSGRITLLQWGRDHSIAET